MKEYLRDCVSNNRRKERFINKLLVLIICICVFASSLAGCSNHEQKNIDTFVESNETYISEKTISENYIQEKQIAEIFYDEQRVTETGLYQFFYEEEIVCEAYLIETVVGTTSVEDICNELNQIFGENIDWKLSFTELAVGTSIIIIAGIAGGIIGPSTYFVTFSAYETLQSAIVGGIVNSVLKILANGVSGETITEKSFAKYAIEGFTEGYMFAAFSSVAETFAQNIVRYIRFNKEYKQYYVIKKDGSIFDLSGKEVGTGYYQDGNIIISKKATSKVTDKENVVESVYPSKAVIETADGEKCYTDDAGKIFRIDKQLLPNSSYIIGNAKYYTDSNGRIIRVSFDSLTLKPEGRMRLKILDTMEDIGRGDALKTDHRGHLIADLFDGDNSMANIVPMSAELNLKEVKNIEEIWKESIKAGKNVSGEIRIKYTADSFRPTAFEYSYRIDNGEKIVVNLIN